MEEKEDKRFSDKPENSEVGSDSEDESPEERSEGALSQTGATEPDSAKIEAEPDDSAEQSDRAGSVAEHVDAPEEPAEESDSVLAGPASDESGIFEEVETTPATAADEEEGLDLDFGTEEHPQDAGEEPPTRGDAGDPVFDLSSYLEGAKLEDDQQGSTEQDGVYEPALEEDAGYMQLETADEVPSRYRPEDYQSRGVEVSADGRVAYSPTAKEYVFHGCLALISGLLLLASFAPFHTGQLAFIALVPWIYVVVSARSSRGVFVYSLVTGLVAYMGGLLWLNSLNLALYLFVSAYLTAYLVVAGLFARPLWQRLGMLAPLFFAALWTGLEFVRSRILTGAPWMQLGHTQWQFLPLLQCADVIGGLGIGFLVALSNATLAFLFVARRRRKKFGRRTPMAALALVVVFCMLVFAHVAVYGFKCIQSLNMRLGPVVGLIQTCENLRSMHDFYAPEGEKKLSGELKAIKHAAGLTDGIDSRVDLLVWPAWTVRRYLNIDWLELDRDAGDAKLFAEASAAIRRATARAGAPMLVPAPALFTSRKELLSGELAAGFVQSQKDAPLETKSILMFSQGGKLVDRYDKAVLLPFVEYTPLKKTMPFLSRYCVLERDIVRGGEGFLLSFRVRERRQPVRVAPAICEEEMRAGLIRHRRLAGADFVVSVSEEGWFQNGWHQYDRLGSAVLRAVETRTSVARAASLGVSCIITPLGRIVAAVDGDAEDRTKSLLSELGVASPAPGGRLRPIMEFLWNKKPEAAKAGVLAAPVLIADEKSYYLRNGDMFAVCCLCLSVGMIVAGLASFRAKSPV